MAEHTLTEAERETLDLAVYGDHGQFGMIDAEEHEQVMADLSSAVEAILAARLARVEALTVCTTGPDGRECADCRILGGHGVSIADVRAALAPVEPATEEADRG